MEQVAINQNDGSQFPRNIRRLQTTITDDDDGNTMIAVDDDVDHRIYSLGNMNINIFNNKIMINWIFNKDDKNHIDKNYYFATSIDMKKKKKNDYTDLVKNALELWRANNLFDQHQFSIIYTDTSNMRSSLPKITKTHSLPYKEDIYNDLDDRIYRQFIMENVKYEIIEKQQTGDVRCRKLDDGKKEIVFKKKQLKHITFINDEEKKENQHDALINYEGIINSKLLNGVNDTIWAELDEMDDNGLNGKYEDKSVIIFNKKHQRDRFNEKIFRLVSLQKIQSIISVLKQEIEGNRLSKEFNNKPLIIAISNEQLLFDYKKETVHSTKFAKSMSYIFETQSFIKRIDSKGTIYDINIINFEKDIIAKNYLHDFMAISSKVYKSTLFIFKRAKFNNIYISHNGFIRKLSLNIYNEDLYYFLPSFITLEIGSYIDIESFSYPDCGTIIKCIKSIKMDEMIYYKIRSSQNVYYTLNYYEITNRSSPNIYYKHCRKALIDKNKKLKNLLLWNKNMKTKRDPSDISHPLHIISLSLLESSKQAIAAIDNDKNININDIQNKLKQSGIIYLLYRTVKNTQNTKDIDELLKEQEDMINDKDFNEKTSKLYIDPLILDNFENSQSIYKDKDGLDELIGNLEKKKLISNREIINKEMNYHNLIEIHQDILSSNNNNKIYIIHIIEIRELIAIQDPVERSEDNKDINKDKGEEAITDKIQYDEDEDEEESDSEDWLQYEEDEEDGELKAKQKEKPKYITMKTTFECKIEYKYEMARVYKETKTVQDLMIKYRNINNDNNDNNDNNIIYNESIKWTMDENRLLTFFCNNMVYNEYDLNDKNIVHKLRRILYENCNQPRFIKLYKKFEEFIKRVNDDKKKENKLFMRSVNNCIINGVEITRNAVLLQQEYINSIINKEEEEKEEKKKDDKKEDIISINKTMVITYNPLQSCVITNNYNKDITHPIHIYRSAYSKDLSNFYNDFGLKQLYNGWMNQPLFPETVDKLYQQNESARPKVNIIDTLSLLIRYNKKYEIVLIPSSIYIKQSFLNNKCNPIAPDIEAVSKHRVTFIYKGILYNYNKGGFKKEEKKKEEEEDDEDRFFLDEIKFLVRKIKENIIEDSIDCMDPPYSSNKEEKRVRIRSIIKRNNKDIMLRWLKIGCGSCFLHEPSGRQNEIGPPISGDYDRDFPDLLKKAMFIYYIDCKISFNENSSNNTCNLCENYMINPTKIIKPKSCKHRFCRKCIIEWKEMINNPEWGTMKENFEKNNVNITELIENGDNDKVLNSIILPKYCPLYIECHVELGDIETDKKYNDNDDNLSMTVYQQLLEENNIRYHRLNLLNKYQQKREVQLVKDQNNLTLQKMREKYPNYDAILSGYQ